MKKEILIVDDAKFMRLHLAKMMEEFGCSIKGEAGDGLEALEKYIRLSPDLVTIDIVMPKMGGVKTIKRIKEVDPTANIVVCSAMGQRTIVGEAIKAGAIDFIVKPVDKKKLEKTLNNIFS